MKMTFNKAIEIAKTGDFETAWNVAKQDDGILPETTKAQWIEFAKKTIKNRKQREETTK